MVLKNIITIKVKDLERNINYKNVILRENQKNREVVIPIRVVFIVIENIKVVKNIEKNVVLFWVLIVVQVKSCE